MTILESAIKQDEVLDRLNPNNLSFIRFITFKDNSSAFFGGRMEVM